MPGGEEDDLVTYQIMSLFLEQPLVSPRSAKYIRLFSVIGFYVAEQVRTEIEFLLQITQVWWQRQ